jgi:hypothetical protein
MPLVLGRTGKARAKPGSFERLLVVGCVSRRVQ